MSYVSIAGKVTEGRYDKRVFLSISLSHTVPICFLHSDWHGICVYFMPWLPQNSSYEFSHLAKQRKVICSLDCCGLCHCCLSVPLHIWIVKTILTIKMKEKSPFHSFSSELRFSVFSTLSSIILPKLLCLDVSGRGGMLVVSCLRHKPISPAFESFHLAVDAEAVAVTLLPALLRRTEAPLAELCQLPAGRGSGQEADTGVQDLAGFNISLGY